jgi:hypothetical protein
VRAAVDGRGCGLRFVPVEHGANRQFAPEEAERIREEIERLVGVEWKPRRGSRGRCAARTWWS